jgi:hypothetical protein
MISILALVVGMFGMLGLWGLAWQLWTEALATEPTRKACSSGAGPSPSRKESIARVGSTELGAVPVVRVRPNSDANTSLFTRSDLDPLGEPKMEKTEILLHDEDILEAPVLDKREPPLADPVPVTGTQKTLFVPPPPPQEIP